MHTRTRAWLVRKVQLAMQLRLPALFRKTDFSLKVIACHLYQVYYAPHGDLPGGRTPLGGKCRWAFQVSVVTRGAVVSPTPARKAGYRLQGRHSLARRRLSGASSMNQATSSPFEVRCSLSADHSTGLPKRASIRETGADTQIACQLLRQSAQVTTMAAGLIRLVFLVFAVGLLS